MSALVEYVQERVKAGLPRAQIRDELVAVGWSEDEAETAYRDALVALGVPVPEPSARVTPAHRASAVDVVVNVFSFILLGIVATALGTLYFRIIDRAFPDPLTALTGAGALAMTRAIHYAIASLVIGFPLYLLSMWIWFRGFHRDPARIESRITKWLTYLVLLITATLAVGDLIAVLFFLLQGEVTVRFLLKALTILTLSGLIFLFYYLERRRVQYGKLLRAKALRSLATAVGTIVLVGVVAGFFSAGSPQTARRQAFDLERARVLGALAGCIEGYARTLGQLPSSLATLRSSARYAHCAVWMRDPETQQEYPYRIVTAARAQGAVEVGEFELCATFALASPAPTGGPGLTGGSTAIWREHGAGRSCHTVVTRLGSTPAAPAPGK